MKDIFKYQKMKREENRNVDRDGREEGWNLYDNSYKDIDEKDLNESWKKSGVHFTLYEMRTRELDDAPSTQKTNLYAKIK